MPAAKRKQNNRKRGNYARSYSRQKNNSRAHACIQGYMHPMRDLVQKIKIPDGGANMSSGVRHNTSSAVPNSADDEFFICIRPSMVNAFYTMNTKVTGINTNTPANMTPLPLANMMTASEIASWRCVSVGATITPTMNGDNDQGFFEAVRVPSLDDAVQHVNWGSITNHPSYINGRLTDLSRYVFQLKPTSTNHEFINGSTLLDKQFDTIFIRCSGIVGSNVGNFLIHSIHNYEYQYMYTSNFMAFTDGSVTDLNGLYAAQAELMSSIKAGTPRGY